MNRIQSGRMPLIRLTALLLVMALLFSAALASGGSTPQMHRAAAEESVDDLRDEKAKLEAQEAQKALLQQQIDVKVAEISVNKKLLDELDAKIGDKNYEIAQKEQAIGKKEAEISDRFQELRQRLRTIFMRGTMTSKLQMLLDSENLSDYLMQTKAMERLTASNRVLMDELEAQLQAIKLDKLSLEADKEALAKERAPIVELQTELNTKKQELDVLYSEINAVTEQLNADIDHYNASIAESEAAAARIQDKIDDIIRTTIGTGQAFLSGSMYWPAPTALIISSTFKTRWGRLHGGIDITGGGCYGEPIVAAADGVVQIAEWDDSYGYYVMIDHGNDSAGRRIMTLYGHSCQLLVSPGQTVSAGETIALIGSTGNSTGAHLHFEVRVDGDRVDPIANGYVSTSGITIDESL